MKKSKRAPTLPPAPKFPKVAMASVTLGAVIGSVVVLFCWHPWSRVEIHYAVDVVCPPGYTQRVVMTRVRPQHYTVFCMPSSEASVERPTVL